VRCWAGLPQGWAPVAERGDHGLHAEGKGTDLHGDVDVLVSVCIDTDGCTQGLAESTVVHQQMGLCWIVRKHGRQHAVQLGVAEHAGVQCMCGLGRLV
jgi:hypothetical protein